MIYNMSAINKATASKVRKAIIKHQTRATTSQRFWSFARSVRSVASAGIRSVAQSTRSAAAAVLDVVCEEVVPAVITRSCGAASATLALTVEAFQVAFHAPVSIPQGTFVPCACDDLFAWFL